MTRRERYRQRSFLITGPLTVSLPAPYRKSPEKVWRHSFTPIQTRPQKAMKPDRVRPIRNLPRDVLFPVLSNRTMECIILGRDAGGAGVGPLVAFLIFLAFCIPD